MTQPMLDIVHERVTGRARKASPRALLLPAVHDGLAHGGETAANRFPAAAAQEDKEKRVVVPADGVARGSGQRQQRQRAHGGSGTARACGRADAAPATKSASAPEAQRWAFVTGSIVHSSPAVSPDGASIFVGSDDGKVYALNAATGAQRWAFATGGYVSSSSAVSPDGASIFVGSGDNKVYALNAATGAQRWAFETGSVVWSSPAVRPDCASIFVGSFDGKVYALNSAMEVHMPPPNGVPVNIYDEFYSGLDVLHFVTLFGASCGIFVVVACLALAARCCKSAMVPCSWLVTWVVYSIVAFAVTWLHSVGLVLFKNRLITDLVFTVVFTACYNSLFHVFVMAVLILGRIRGNNKNEQTRQVPQASLHASAQTVVFSAQLTCCEELFFATIGLIIQLGSATLTSCTFRKGCSTF